MTLLRATASALLLLAGFGAFSVLARVEAKENAKAPKDVSTMNLEVLKESLLKIWVIEESSERYNQMRIATTSFEALVPLVETGDPETDAKNREEQEKTHKAVQHFLELELDGAIETVDICRRVLGKQPKLDPGAAARRRFLKRELPTITWPNMKLDRALQDLGRKLGIRVELTNVPKNVKLELDLYVEGANVEQVIDMIISYHYMEWTYEDDVLTFKYME